MSRWGKTHFWGLLIGAIGAIATGYSSAGAVPAEATLSRAPDTEPYLPLTIAPPTMALPPLGDAANFLPALERKIVLRLRERRVFLYEGD